jgi:hypothetical protein
MKFSELPDLVGEILTVEVLPLAGEDPRDVQGKLLGVGPAGIVVEVDGDPMIIDRDRILDIRKGIPVRKMVRRKISFIPEARMRQHLLDRHSITWSMARVMTPATAARVHKNMNHDDLGHRHMPEGEGGEE